MADKTTNTLEMVFESAAGKEVVVSLSSPKTGLTKAAVDAVAAQIVAKNIFVSSGSDLVRHKESRIRVLTVTELA